MPTLLSQLYAIWSTGCCTNRVYRKNQRVVQITWCHINLDSFHNLLLNIIVAFVFRTIFIYDAPQIVRVDNCPCWCCWWDRALARMQLDHIFVCIHQTESIVIQGPEVSEQLSCPLNNFHAPDAIGCLRLWHCVLFSYCRVTTVEPCAFQVSITLVLHDVVDVKKEGRLLVYGLPSSCLPGSIQISSSSGGRESIFGMTQNADTTTQASVSESFLKRS